MTLLVELVALWLLQSAWCIYYVTRYRWRSTRLGPVWLAKGSLLAVLWPLLVLDQIAGVPDWVWTALIGPALIAATLAWLAVTIRVDRSVRRP